MRSFVKNWALCGLAVAAAMAVGACGSEASTPTELGEAAPEYTGARFRPIAPLLTSTTAPGPHVVAGTKTGKSTSSVPACTAAGPYLSAALSQANAALDFAQKDYNINLAPPNNPYNPYPQEDLIGTRNLIQALQAATGMDLSQCVNATAAGYDAGQALSDANYATGAEYVIFSTWAANGPDADDPYNAYQHNIVADQNLQVAVQILSNCGCIAPPPSFTASPNPVPIPYGTPTGTTTVSWNAPYHAAMSVFVSENGAPPTPMTGGGSSGSASASWIQAGHAYLFSLYDSADTSNVLASVNVTGYVESQPTLTASPISVQIPYGKTNGTTKLSWNGTGYSSVSLYVSVDGTAQTLVATTGTTGSASADWIQAGHRYLFTLTPAGNPGTVLNAVTVTGQAMPQPTLTASANPVVVPYGQTTSTFTLSWNAPGYAQIDVYGQQNLQNPGQKLLLGTAGTSGSAQEPMSVGEVATLWLYAHGDTSTVLATLQMTGVQGQRPTLTAWPNPVILPADATTGTFTLSWNAPGYDQIDVYGEQNLQNPGQKLLLGTAGTSGSAPEPITVGEFATLWLYPHGDTSTILATVAVTAHH